MLYPAGLRATMPEWSQAHLAKALKKPEVEPRPSPGYTYQTRPLQTDGITMAILGLGALGALQGYLWYRGGEWWKSVLLGLGVFSALSFAGWAYWRIKKARWAANMHDPVLIKENVSRLPFEADLEVTAILSEHGTEARALELLRNVAAAYRHYNTVVPSVKGLAEDRLCPHRQGGRPDLLSGGVSEPRRAVRSGVPRLGARQVVDVHLVVDRVGHPEHAAVEPQPHGSVLAASRSRFLSSSRVRSDSW